MRFNNASIFAAFKKRALDDPDGFAVHTPNGSLTFAHAWIRLNKLVQRLRLDGIQPGSSALVMVQDPLLDWLLCLALLHEGVASCSSKTPFSSEGFSFDCWITDRPVHSPKGRVIEINAPWLNSLDGLGDTQSETKDIPDGGLARILLTSGTSGRRKAVGLSEAMIGLRLQIRLNKVPQLSELSLMTMDGIGGFNTAMAALMTGHPFFICNNAQECMALVRHFKIESLLASPIQLAVLSKALEISGTPLGHLKSVRSGGSPISPTLVQRVQRWICPNIANVYASTETGLIARIDITETSDPSTAGQTVDDAQAEVVDASGETVPLGQSGRLRIKTLGMAHGYLGDPTATQEFFHQGWFYPGDLATINAHGQIRLDGRDNEIINQGGAKLDPIIVDHALLTFPGVEDAAAFGLVDKTGIEHVVAAIVAPTSVHNKAILAHCQKTLGILGTPKALIRMSEIPRNAMGKAMRAELKNVYQKQLL